MRVSILYLDDCPGWQLAEARLTEALGLLGLPGHPVERRVVATDQQARAEHFRGSPTIVVDGEDLFDADSPGPYGLSCRLYPTDTGLAGAPTVDQLVAALRSVAGGAARWPAEP